MWVVAWTWQKFRVVKSQKRGRELIKVWCWWYKRLGWRVDSNGSDCYIATSKDGKYTKHCVQLQEYDPLTNARIS